MAKQRRSCTHWENPVQINWLGVEFGLEQLSWTSHPGFSRSYKSWDYLALSLWNDNYRSLIWKEQLWISSDVFVCQVDKVSVILYDFVCQHETKCSPKREKNFNWRNASLKLKEKNAFFSINNQWGGDFCGWYHWWIVGSGFYTKEGSAIHVNQASKQCNIICISFHFQVPALLDFLSWLYPMMD